LRRRRPRRGSTEALTLWLVFGTIMVLVVLYVAIRANVDRARAPVEGSTRLQQARADSLRAVLERDSSNVQAHVRLGDVLYDTGNWSEAIVHYRAALRRDSSLVTALVDLGVCYYNLGHPEDAERHFRLALAREPHQPQALFNLGIVHERREEYRTALEYFHRALNLDPPEPMRQAVLEAMMRVQGKAGIEAPALPRGSG
jgi:tetratricopeptide (TPR) repeat protein